MDVSIIMPALNVSKYIAAAIRSATAQTLRNIEIIVVDDGSDDDTGQIVRDLAAHDDRIVLIEHGTRKGTSAARNSALAVARGEWIAVQDADDTMEPDRLERMIAEARSRHLDMLADQQWLIDFETHDRRGLAFYHSWMASDKLLGPVEYLKRNWPGLRASYGLGYMKPIIRREFLQEHSLQYKVGVTIAQDSLFFMCVLLAGARFGVTSFAGYNYLLRPLSASRHRKPRTVMLGVNKLMAEALEDYHQSGRLGKSVDYAACAALFPKLEKRLWLQYLTECLKAGEFSNAFKTLPRTSPTMLASAFAAWFWTRCRNVAAKCGAGRSLPRWPDPWPTD